LSFLDPLIHLQASIIIGILAILSYRLRLLDPRGIIASIPVGYIIYVFGGPHYFILLIAFYSVSGLATRFRIKRIGVDVLDKDWIRSWRNVVANGATAASISLLSAFTGDRGSSILLAAYLGAVGTSFADTLATELGLLYPHNPRLITSMKKVPRGTPGGVSPYGYAGGVLALLILATLSTLMRLSSVRILGILLASGMIGMTADSILGATIQAKYRCPRCGKLTENSTHCGEKAEKVSGTTLIDTHMVNLISTIIGASTASILALT